MLEFNAVTEDPIWEAIREWVRDDSSKASVVVFRDVAEELKRWPMSRMQMVRDDDMTDDDCSRSQHKVKRCVLVDALEFASVRLKLLQTWD